MALLPFEGSDTPNQGRGKINTNFNDLDMRLQTLEDVPEATSNVAVTTTDVAYTLLQTDAVLSSSVTARSL